MAEQRTRSWYGQKALEAYQMCEELRKDITTLQDRTKNVQELSMLVDHPIVQGYQSFAERFRRLELTVDNMQQTMNKLVQRQDALERVVANLVRPDRRGA